MGDEAALRQALNDEAKRLIVDCTYSGRGHQQASLRWGTWHTWLGLPTVVGSAILASGAGLNALVGESQGLTAALALLSAVLTATRGFFRPGDLADEHALKGSRYISLRNEARFFREIDLRSDTSLDELARRIQELRAQYNTLNETPPQQIPRWAYEAAKKSIARGESSYEDDPVWRELRS